MCERTRYQKRTPTVRNTHSVLKKASCGTRLIFGSIRCKKQASTVRDASSKARRTADSTDCGQPECIRYASGLLGSAY